VSSSCSRSGLDLRAAARAHVAYRIAQVRPQVSGIIKRRVYTEGAVVAAGQALYQLDPAPYQAALDSARAGARQG